MLRVCVFAAGAPVVIAEIVAVVVPVGVVEVVVIVSWTAVGKLETDAAGEKLQISPAPNPGHESVTVPLNDPAAVTWNVTAGEVFPCCTDTEAGEGAVSPKSTTCSVTGASCVVADGSVPTPCTLNE
jgi:hypothetical protein